ncbi:MAG: DUF4351 domain-containing protein, partial [Rivularia sp. ALOHA_DT_140]|nr:DUF4351 domain-containing protein [Rivularia sp. ALOHA_DT_140]
GRSIELHRRWDNLFFGSSLEQLENLGEALLDFTSMADLQAWLEAQG